MKAALPRGLSQYTPSVLTTVNPPHTPLIVSLQYASQGLGREGGIQVKTILPVRHLERVVCRCPLGKALHQLSFGYCLQFTFTGSYYF